jgi:hypothetical protein
MSRLSFYWYIRRVLDMRAVPAAGATVSPR